jgi:DNA-binding MarR family transcriptional regulator
MYSSLCFVECVLFLVGVSEITPPKCNMLKKNDPFLPVALDGQIGFHLRLAQLAVLNDLIEDLKAWDIRPADVATLGLIEAHPGIRQNVVGTHLKIARPNVVSLIDSLEKRELVERRVDKLDRRANQLKLTPLGVVKLKAAREIEADHHERLLEALRGINVDEFMDGLRRLSNLKRKP